MALRHRYANPPYQTNKEKIYKLWTDRFISNTVSVQFSSFQSLSCVQLFATPWITARQASLSITDSWSSLRLMSIKSVMPSSHLILCRPLLLLPSIPPSVRIFSNESTLHMRWPKYYRLQNQIHGYQREMGYINQHLGINIYTLLLLLLSNFSRIWLCVTP